MVGTLRVHIPHTLKTGPFQEIDRLFLAPVTKGPESLHPLARLLAHNGVGSADAELASQLADVSCVKRGPSPRLLAARFSASRTNRSGPPARTSAAKVLGFAILERVPAARLDLRRLQDHLGVTIVVTGDRAR
jgi:hypothetical protein